MGIAPARRHAHRPHALGFRTEPSSGRERGGGRGSKHPSRRLAPDPARTLLRKLPRATRGRGVIALAGGFGTSGARRPWRRTRAGGGDPWRRQQGRRILQPLRKRHAPARSPARLDEGMDSLRGGQDTASLSHGAKWVGSDRTPRGRQQQQAPRLRGERRSFGGRSLQAAHPAWDSRRRGDRGRACRHLARRWVDDQPHGHLPGPGYGLRRKVDACGSLRKL